MSDDERRRVPGAEFVPPLDKTATAEQIADFWTARGQWNENDKSDFLARHSQQQIADPNRELQERVLHTERMRTEVRNDIAKDMPAEEISQRYEVLGKPELAQEFEKKHNVLVASDEPDKADALRTKTAVAVLLLEERTDRNIDRGERVDQRPERGQEPMGNESDPADAQQAKLDRLLGGMYRDTAHEVTHRHENDGRNGRGE